MCFLSEFIKEPMSFCESACWWSPGQRRISVTSWEIFLFPFPVEFKLTLNIHIAAKNGSVPFVLSFLWTWNLMDNLITCNIFFHKALQPCAWKKEETTRNTTLLLDLSLASAMSVSVHLLLHPHLFFRVRKKPFQLWQLHCAWSSNESRHTDKRMTFVFLAFAFASNQL